MKAALEMRRSLTTGIGSDSKWRNAYSCTGGLNSGRVVAGYMGSTQTMSYTVIGDTVNTAARLCSFAEAGQILISTPIAEELKGRLELVALPETQLKGKARAIPIYNVRAMDKTNDVTENA